MTETKTYEINTRCNNCSKKETFTIPKGMNVHEYKENNECENCGC